MQRDEIIRALTDHMVQNGFDRRQAKNVLETYPDEKLREFYAKRISPKTEPAKHQDVQRGRQQAQLQAEVERDLEYEKEVMEREKAEVPRRKAEQAAKQARARQVFAAICRKHDLSGCDGNFHVLFSSGLLDSEYAATQAVQSKTVGLVQANEQEQRAYQQEKIEQHNEELRNIAETDPAKLRTIVRQEAEQARATAVQADAQRHADAEQARDSHLGFPKLPDVWQGQNLDADFIRRCSVETHKFLQKRFGNFQLNARLNGRG